MKPSEEIVREMRSEWPDRQTGMIADLRVDVAGYPVVVKGESARDHLEAVNRDLARLRLDNARLRTELAEAKEERDTTATDLHDALREVRAELAAPRVRAEGWRTMESAPHDDPEARVLIWTAHRALEIGYNDVEGEDQCWRDLEGDELIDPVAWRPLPPPPDAAP